MAYTRQQVLDKYNSSRGTSFTFAQLGDTLAKQALQNELAQLLRQDAKPAEDAQIGAI